MTTIQLLSLITFCWNQNCFFTIFSITNVSCRMTVFTPSILNNMTCVFYILYLFCKNMPFVN
uniref:Uncharacterized protein n=1 Tax=Octopus bimaculoides TaxID=37653 RepID=A0A0L8HP05_OCTBM